MSGRLAGRVLERLGFQNPPTLDLGGLSDLYRAWCLRVPFDNTRKMIALLRGDDGLLPGALAEDFLEHWLVDSSDELKQSLHDEMGLSKEAIGRWADSGALAASFEPSPQGPSPPPENRLPPSKREAIAC